MGAPSGAVPKVERSPLYASSVRGFAWLTAAQLATQLVHLGIRLTLARLLAPEAFGVMAMAVVFLTLGDLLLDLGLSDALVQRRRLTESHRSTALWASAGFALVLSAILYLAAPAIARLYRSEAVTSILRVLALAPALAFPATTYRALLQRQMRFRALGAARLAATVVAGAVGITVAWRGGGAWALVADHLTRTVVGSLLLIPLAGWRPRALVSGTAFAELWRFGRTVVGARVVSSLTRTLDNFLIGRYLQASALGLYSLAYQAVLVPLQYFARPLATVSFPAFARLRDDLPRCRHAYLETLRVVVLATWPVAGLGLFAAGELVPALLGPQWAGAVRTVRILSGVALLQPAMSLGPPVFRGLGRPDLSLRLALAFLALAAAGIVGGLPWGVEGVATGYLLAAALFTPLHFSVLLRLLRLPSAGVVGAFARTLPPLAASGLLWTACVRVTAPADPLARIALALGVSLAGYALLARVSHRQGCRAVAEAMAALRGRRRPQAGTAGGR